MRCTAEYILYGPGDNVITRSDPLSYFHCSNASGSTTCYLQGIASSPFLFCSTPELLVIVLNLLVANAQIAMEITCMGLGILYS